MNKIDFRNEFKKDHPETIGEKDKAFDNSNYINWLEKKLAERDKQIELERKIGINYRNRNTELLKELKAIKLKAQPTKSYSEEDMSKCWIQAQRKTHEPLIENGFGAFLKSLPSQEQETIEGEKDNWNNEVTKKELNKWHKVDKDNFVSPPSSTNIVFFTKAGDVFCGHYKGSEGFTCYGINKEELKTVEVTYWRLLPFPDEYQKMLDDMDKPNTPTL